MLQLYALSFEHSWEAVQIQFYLILHPFITFRMHAYFFVAHILKANSGWESFLGDQDKAIRPLVSICYSPDKGL